MRLGRVLLAAGIAAARLVGQGGDEAPAWRDLQTPDGSRFLLVRTSDVPVIRWITAVPAGDRLDPIEYPGLSYAVVRASMSGTDTIGTSDWREERRALGDLRRAEVQIEASRARGESPPEDLQRALDRAQRELRAIVDTGAWRRALESAPALGVEVDELPEAVLTTVTTEPAGFATVARLLMDRRENAVLRTLDESYRAVTRRLARESSAPATRLRAEVRDLAYFGLGLRDDYTVPRVDPDVALDLFHRMYSPTATLHVITGGFDLEQVAAFLQRQFAVSSLPRTTTPTAAPRRSSRERLSTIVGGNRDALAVGFEIAPDADLQDLRVLADWFAGGPESHLATQLRDAGILEAQVSFELPFPSDADPGLLLVEVWGRPRAPDTPAPDLLTVVRGAIEGAATARLKGISDADRRTRMRTAVEMSDPLWRGRWLAIECGIRGREPALLIEPPERPWDFDAYRALSSTALTEANRCIVRLEVAK